MKFNAALGFVLCGAERYESAAPSAAAASGI
jgi:hypothetical protein